MSNTSIQQNYVTEDFDLHQLLLQWKKQIMLELNSMAIGTIQSFNAGSATLTAQGQCVIATINYQKTFFQYNDLTGAYTAFQQSYPTLVDVPLFILGGGGCNLTMPVQAGDECIILFNDRDLDNWFQSAQFGPCATARLHSFSDGIALVGVNSTPNQLTNYDPQRTVLRSATNGTGAVVGVNPTNSKVLITNTAPSGINGGNLTYSASLRTLLQTMITHLENLANACAAITVSVTSAPGTSGVPLNAATLSGVATNLASDATALAGLLE